MSGPLANLAAEFAALTGRMQHVLASLPDNGGDYAELAAVCHRHGIQERQSGEVDLDGEPIRVTLPEALDLALTASVKKARRHDELTVALGEQERINRDNAGEVGRARRDGKAVLNLIGDAKGKLDEAGFNTDAMGWLAGLDDALAELHAWRTGRRRALAEVPWGWVEGHATPAGTTNPSEAGSAGSPNVTIADSVAQRVANMSQRRGTAVTTSGGGGGGQNGPPGMVVTRFGGAGGQYPGAPGQPGMGVGGGIGGKGGSGWPSPDDDDDGCAPALVPA